MAPFVGEVEALAGTAWACRALGVSRATLHRRRNPPPARAGPPAPRRPPWTLDDDEVAAVLDVLHSERFCEASPGQVWAILLDEGEWLCSLRSMYRILEAVGENRDRRRQATHPPRVKPHLVAMKANEVWSWDITKLPGPRKGVYYDLYSIMDIYSRKAVGWRVEITESGEWAAEFIAKAVAAEGADPRRLTVHADRGTSMTSNDVTELYKKLKITRSHSRPKTSNDNPYSEASYRTLKYCPAYPGWFTSVEHARTWCAAFFDYYNHEHRHSRLGWHTPASVHDGTARQIRVERQAVLDAAYATHPERFRKGPPVAPKIPDCAWINEIKETIGNK